MTVAIAVLVPGKDSEIVTISDARLSYGEMIPAADDATMKNVKLSKRWGVMFAATDATAFDPVSEVIFEKLGTTKPGSKLGETDFAAGIIVNAARDAYEKEFKERFFRDQLSRFGFADIADFRRVGFAEMGKELYHEYAAGLARFDLGLELLIYGFDELGHRYIFEIANPGKIISHTKRGYAAIGSGTLMALAALNKKPITRSLSDVIYRSYDAKFSSETARDVGRTTHVITLNRYGVNGFSVDTNIEDMFRIWSKDLKRPHPQEAMDLIERSFLVQDMKKKKPRKPRQKKSRA